MRQPLRSKVLALAAAVILGRGGARCRRDRLRLRGGSIVPRLLGRILHWLLGVMLMGRGRQRKLRRRKLRRPSPGRSPGSSRGSAAVTRPMRRVLRLHRRRTVVEPLVVVPLLLRRGARELWATTTVVATPRDAPPTMGPASPCPPAPALDVPQRGLAVARHACRLRGVGTGSPSPRYRHGGGGRGQRHTCRSGRVGHRGGYSRGDAWPMTVLRL